MPNSKDRETITESFDHWVEFTDTAINLTGIPDDQFRSTDEGGTPVVETESMDYPLLEFHDDATDLTGTPDEESADDDLPGANLDQPGANGAAHPPVPPAVPPKSV